MDGTQLSRRDVIKGGIAVGGLALFAPLMVSCGTSTGGAVEDTLARARREKIIRVAFGNEPPYAYVGADGNVTGASEEVARAIFKKLGIPNMEAVLSPYGSMVAGLESGRFDVVTAGLAIRPTRCQAVNFGEPDTCDADGFAVLQGNPLALKSYADVKNNPSAKVGVEAGAVEDMDATAAGIPDARIVRVTDNLAGVTAVQVGRINAFANPLSSLHIGLGTLKSGAKLEIVGPLPESKGGFCAAAAFRKSDTDFLQAWNTALKEMKASGDFAKIVGPFGFDTSLASVKTTAEWCTPAPSPS